MTRTLAAAVRRFISPTSRRRGESYFLSGRVSAIRADSADFSAAVRGTRWYDVSLTLDEHRLSSTARARTSRDPSSRASTSGPRFSPPTKRASFGCRPTSGWTSMTSRSMPQNWRIGEDCLEDESTLGFSGGVDREAEPPLDQRPTACDCRQNETVLERTEAQSGTVLSVG